MQHAFITASKRKLRFKFNGNLAVEDLWDLPLRDLDKMAVAIHESLQGSRKTFLDDPSPADASANSDQTLRLEILKEVIAVRQAENRAKREAAERKAEIDFLERLLEKKRIDKLESMDIAEIENRLRAARGEVPVTETATAVS